MKLYYIKISFMPKQCDYALLVGRCIKVLHGFLLRNQIKNIGVAFPCWSKSSIGNQICFMSNDPQRIEDLINQNYFKKMCDLELFKIDSICELTEYTDNVVYVRNQAIDKRTPYAKARILRRAKRRAEARGEKFAPTNTTRDDLDFFHQVPMDSQESGNSYMLNIQRIIAAEPDVSGNYEFCSYGLSTQKKITCVYL